MKERPILFNAPMVRALLAGTKTQTRRICKPQPYGNGFMVGHELVCHNDYLPPSVMLMDVGKGKNQYTTSDAEGWESDCPYGAPGDSLWVRETFARYNIEAHRHDWAYAATPAADWPKDGRWRPSIHMPRAASRITLEVTGVRVERLQKISEADALAEGARLHTDKDPDYGYAGWYRALWESINGPESWAANPWVWVVEFKRLPDLGGGKS